MIEVSPAQRSKLNNYSVIRDGSPEIIQHLADITIVGVTGPSAVGTTSIINRSGLYKVPGFTTRPQRNESDVEIRFRPHTASSIDEIIDQAWAGSLVQVWVSDTGYIYGTEQDDYVIGKPNVVDMVAGSILEFCDMPIKELIPVAVVCDPDQWERRFLEDRGEFFEQRDRIWDDIESLRRTIDNPYDPKQVSFFLLVNNDGELDKTAQKFKAIAKGDKVFRLGETGSSELRDQLLGRMSLVASS